MKILPLHYALTMISHYQNLLSKARNEDERAFRAAELKSFETYYKTLLN